VASEAAAIVARARSLIGTAFRAQGRSPERGVDCIGLAVIATGVEEVRVPDDYPLRGGDPAQMDAVFEALGFARVPYDRREPGDVLVARSGPGQLHVVVLTADGYVHAHAGLRRVVEAPGALPWYPLAAWRHSGRGR
jgi:cell wall-associated NlpC family hydrolase